MALLLNIGITVFIVWGIGVPVTYGFFRYRKARGAGGWLYWAKKGEMWRAAFMWPAIGIVNGGVGIARLAKKL